MSSLTFAAELKRLRERTGLSRDQLAQLTFIAPTTLRNIEQGQRNPTIEFAREVVRVLALSGAERGRFLQLAMGSRSGRDHVFSLPEALTSFVGREEELKALTQMLAARMPRLITLLGLGGAGKTRLAREAALWAGTEYSHGVAFVPLAEVHTQEGVVPAILAALGERPQGGRSLEAQLIDLLSDRTLLLVLDNAEHLPALPMLVDELLNGARHITILCTSREPLQLQGEHRFPLEGLQFDVTTGIDTDALRLFRDRAGNVTRTASWSTGDQSAARDICQVVSGLPLALELSAALCALMSPADVHAVIARNMLTIESDFHNVPERHRSLRAVLDASWQQLSGEEQIALRRLAVFAGGADQSAAARVCGVAEAVFKRLATRSLLILSDNGRIGLHEMVRQYGEARLDEAGEHEAISAQHIRWVKDLSSGLVDLLFHASHAERASAFAKDAANIRAGIDRGVERADTISDAANALGILCWYWYSEGLWDIPRKHLPALITRTDIAWEPRAHGFAQLMLGMLHYFGGNMQDALPFLNASVNQFQSAGMQDELIIAQGSRVTAAAQAGDLPLAIESFRACLDGCESTESAFARGYGLSTCAFLPMYSGDLDQGIAMFGQALTEAERISDHWTIGLCTLFLSAMHLERDNLEEAERALEKLDNAATQSGSYEHAAALRVNTAFAQIRREKADAARAQIDAALTHYERVDLSRRLSTLLIAGAWIRQLQHDDTGSAELLARAEQLQALQGGPALHPDRAYAERLEAVLGQSPSGASRVADARASVAGLKPLTLPDIMRLARGW